MSELGVVIYQFRQFDRHFASEKAFSLFLDYFYMYIYSLISSLHNVSLVAFLWDFHTNFLGWFFLAVATMVSWEYGEIPCGVSKCRCFETVLSTHCSQEQITNPQKHCRIKPKWFLDLLTYFQHAYVNEIW